jgi:hypothetical protein
MHTHMLEEMSDSVAEHCGANRDDVLHILSEYWSDKIAHVWQVEDVIKAAVRRGIPTTVQVANDSLQNIFDHLDCEYGITWTTIEVALEDYDFDLRRLSPDDTPNVYGIFNVHREGESGGIRFGSEDNDLGNFPDALAFAEQLARENPDKEIIIESVSDCRLCLPQMSVVCVDGEIVVE